VLVPSREAGILATRLHADGSQRGMLCVPGQVRNGAVDGTPFVHMDGQAVFKFAVRVLAEAADETLAAVSMPRSAIDWLIPHQANLRIMDATAKRLEIPPERVVVTVDRHANTSAASVPLALDEAVRDGRIRAGHHVMMLGVGGGFTWGAALVRWG
jgi:3-oxoacyl-[acyl-carrier-protein] synthase-3